MANQHKKHGRRPLEQRQIQADERQAARDSRSNEKQISLLQTRPGNSAKEIARLS